MPLFANLGAVQLNYGVTVDAAKRALAEIEADGLYPLNPLQEALQPRGDTNFRDLLPKIAALARDLGAPVIAKGVGSGISPATAARLLDAGSPRSTSPARRHVVGARRGAPGRRRRARSAGPDVRGLGLSDGGGRRRAARRAADATIVVSGGIRSGVDVAKALALGADLCGVGLPLLRPATESAEAATAALAALVAGLRIAQFASGSRAVRDLRSALHARR